MCITNALQQKIRKHTDNGDLIAQFLADTIRGEYPDAKYHHRLEAVKLLARYGSDQPESEESQFWGLIPTPEELEAAKNTPSPSTGEGWDGGEESSNSVTHLDILNYDIAHLIRQETAEGHTIAEFLAHVMTRRDKPFTPKKLRIKHTDRMAAAKEILRRGHGHWSRKPKLKVYADDVEDTNDYDTLHTDLAKRMREYNEHGTDAIRFLLDVMSDTSLDPEEGYTWHHKMSAAHEIIRRGWDTNYDNITPEMLQAYWQDQQSTRLSVGQKKQLAGLPTTLVDYDHHDTEDYQAIADAIRDQEDREDASAPGKSPLSPKFTRHSCESRNPAGRGAGAETTNPFVLSLSKDESASNRMNNEAIANRHSRENRNPAASENPLSPHSNRHSCESRNPAGQGQGAGYDGRETSFPSFTPMPAPANEETTFTDDLDCYYEPLTPEDQAIFNYNSLIESGEFEEGEITFVPPSEAARRDYAIALKQIKKAAASEGVPLLPNPLAGTLRKPSIRSP